MLGSSPLHTGAASLGKHHWYPDVDMMKQLEGKMVLYDDDVPEDSLSGQLPPNHKLEQEVLDNWDKPIPEKFVRYGAAQCSSGYLPLAIQVLRYRYIVNFVADRYPQI